MEGEGFEPPNPKERIYNPPRLASSLPFQTLYSLNGWNNQWELTGSNRWPSACKADALPAELNSQRAESSSANGKKLRFSHPPIVISISSQLQLS